MRIFGIGMQELLVILLICLLVFGAGRLPEIARSLGKAIREFKKSMKEIGPEEEEGEEEKKNPKSQIPNPK